MFEVNSRTKSGFNIQFENGFSVSVQWGPRTYSDNYNESHDSKNLISKTAEVAIMSPTGSLIGPDDSDNVYSYVTADQLLEILAKAQKLSTFHPSI